MKKHARISMALVAMAVTAGCSALVGPGENVGESTADVARYRVRFESRWTSMTHPIDFPSNAHFSRLVGGNHNASVSFWGEGQPASPGIRAMAEMGRVTPLDTEIMTAMSVGGAESVFIGPALDQSPDAVTMELMVSQRFPLVTLVTMVAPSPDWFVGVAGVPLFEGGRWAQERRVELSAWDAGTDSGQTFTSADTVTNPFGTITRILTAPLSPNGNVSPLGSFTFARIQ